MYPGEDSPPPAGHAGISARTRSLLRWWMTSLNQLAWEPPSSVARLLAAPESRELWQRGTLPGGLAAFQAGYFSGILTAAHGSTPLPRAGTTAWPVRLPVAASYLPTVEEVASVVCSAGLPSPEAVAAAAEELLEVVARRPVEAAASFGRLLGLLWKPIHQHGDQERAVVVLQGLASCVTRHKPASVSVADRRVTRVVDSTGSGKRRVLTASVSTAAAFVAACLAREHGWPVVVAKSVSGGTSFSLGSADWLRQLTGEVTDPKVALAMGQRFGLSFWRSETATPRFARLYHGMTFAPTVMSLCAPGVLASPVVRTRVIYGLTDGPVGLCARLLAQLLPATEVLVLSGRDRAGRALLDEPSPSGPTRWVRARGSSLTSGSWELVADGRQQSSSPTALAPVPLQNLLAGQITEPVRLMIAAQAALILDQRVPPSPDLTEAALGCLGSRTLLRFVSEYAQAAAEFRRREPQRVGG